MKREFNVWIEIDEYLPESRKYQNREGPICLREFETEKEAVKFVEKLKKFVDRFKEVRK